MTDYLSRHPLPEVPQTNHELYIKAVIEADHAIVMETIRSASTEDKVLQKLKTQNKEMEQKGSRPGTIPRFESRNLRIRRSPAKAKQDHPTGSTSRQDYQHRSQTGTPRHLKDKRTHQTEVLVS